MRTIVGNEDLKPPIHLLSTLHENMQTQKRNNTHFCDNGMATIRLDEVSNATRRSLVYRVSSCAKESIQIPAGRVLAVS